MRRALLLMLAVAVAGCEDQFEPFEDSDIAFSLFGYLDAAADTQFVRVASLRQSAFENAPVEAVVTLDDLARGETVMLRDSVIEFANGAIVHNFWTDALVRPSASYRLTATGPDGRASSALFEMPPDFPNPELESGLSEYSSVEFPPTAQSMTFYGIEKLADLRVTYALDNPTTTVTISYLTELNRSQSGAYLLAFNAYTDVQRAIGGSEGTACPSLRWARVLVAAATADWPDLADLDPETLALPGTASNVEGGLGYIGGVITRSREWETMRGVFSLHHQGCVE